MRGSGVPRDDAGAALGWAAAFGVVILWSGWLVVSRLGVQQTLTIWDIGALRFLVAAAVTAPFVARFWPRHLPFWKILLLGCGPGIPYALFAFAGMQHAPASHAGILINGTLPIFAAATAWIWLRDRPDGWKLGGMAVILGGCMLIAWDRETGGAPMPLAWLGHLFFLASAAILGAYMVATKLWGLTAMQALVALPLANLVWYLPIYIAFLPKRLAEAPWPEIALQSLFQGLGPSVLGVLLFTTAIRRIGSTPAAAVMALVPGVAALLAIPILAEWPSLLVWGGLILTTAGIALTAGWRPVARARTAAP